VSQAASSSGTTIDVVIPALNEERSLPLVLADLPRPPVRRVVVADNGSQDGTARVAREGGAEVVPAPRRGYGSACLAGLAHLRGTGPPDVVAFVDADYSDHPDELPLLVAPLLAGAADVAIGSRVLGRHERGALLPQARAGNLVACLLIRLLYSATSLLFLAVLAVSPVKTRSPPIVRAPRVTRPSGRRRPSRSLRPRRSSP